MNELLLAPLVYCEDLAGPALSELDFGSFQRSLRVGQMYRGGVKSTQEILMPWWSWEFTHCSCICFPYSTDGKHFGQRDRAVCRKCFSMPLGLGRERNHQQMTCRLVSCVCPRKNVVTKWTYEYCTIVTGHKVVIIIIIVFPTCDLKTQKFFLACGPYPAGTDQIWQTSQKLFLSVPALSCWSAHQNFLVATSFSLASYFKLKIKII